MEFCAIDEATRVSGAGTLRFRLLTNRLKRDQDRSLKTVAFLGVIIQVHIYMGVVQYFFVLVLALGPHLRGPYAPLRARTNMQNAFA